MLFSDFAVCLKFFVCLCVCLVTSVVSDSATLWTVVHKALQSMEFSRQEYWSGLPFLSPEIFHNIFKE